ncbi:PREDICTED: uncharacterized protein LOC109221946 [Nicotiana attenuata]|uniref:uncharacterized protein LOC109221946 n=1 Tax=Nicotiana attenuata TaxID=49451 RepID=UPI0009050645|nr:PREDICTED: uncharacterized protein LOC109221946 [Nicotiana attenuata]
MANFEKVVGVKKVRQKDPDGWDVTMPLPGDIIEGIGELAADDDSFVQAKTWSELALFLGKIVGHFILLKVRRGESRLKLRGYVLVERRSNLQKRFVVRAASDERHLAVIAELTLGRCTELQEMSRRMVNSGSRGYNQMGLQYDWKMKVGTYLPDSRSTIVSSILFMPLTREYRVEATMVRTMAWFSAAVSSGIPLVFVNIQTEQISNLVLLSTFSDNKQERRNNTGKDLTWGRQLDGYAGNQSAQGVRLWYLPGIEEVPLELTPEPGETRFGIDIKRTDEGFVSIYSVTKGTAAERAGLVHLFEQANKSEQLLVISRLEGKSLLPSTVSPEGLIYCCDHGDIKETLNLAMERSDSIRLHIMSWPNQTTQNTTRSFGAAVLMPPN